MVHDDGTVGLDGLRVAKFDDERAVQGAGVALVAVLAGRLGIEPRRVVWCGCAGIGRARRTSGAR